ncbi:MAG TPA: phage tail tape measure protein [Polyangiaceae bacterium]|nr:phage tail tape measure protein [Polyangiaceae bacterium]
MLNNLGLGFVFTAKDFASGKIQQLERSFLSLDKKVGLGTDSIKGSFRELGLGTALFAAGAAGVVGAFTLADKASAFEQSVAAVAAVSGATATELAALKEAALDAGIATQFSPTEATVGLKELAQAGFHATESIQLLLPVLDLAAGSLGELSPAQAAGLASQAMKAFGVSAADAGVAVDRMLQAVNVFALNASELPQALGIASRGAQALHQNLSETLVALGLVKNVIPGVERASTGVAVAMERMADPKVQAALKGLGVEVVDGAGHFRAFLDVVGDLVPALGQMTDAKRSAFLIDTFGAHALGSLQAILTQVTDGIRTSAGATVKGADAIAYLRTQFEQAGGTAASFRDKMLDTFAGQRQLLRGSLETLAILLGEPFAQVFKPVVAGVVGGLNVLLKTLRALPLPVKRAFAGFFVAASAVLALVGGVVAAKATVALLALGLKAVGVTLGGVVSTLLPAIAVVALLGVAVAGLYVAFERNVGGIADAARRAGERVTLAFRALVELFEGGGFSGAVREELGRAENAGLKRFVVAAYMLAFRLGRVWDGVKEGFVSALEGARPVFDDLREAFAELSDALGDALGALVGGAASLPSAPYLSFGQRVGGALATVATALVRLAAAGARLATGFVGGLRAMGAVVGPAFDAIGQAFERLRLAWARLTGAADAGAGAAAASTAPWRALGELLGGLASVVVTVLGFALAGALDLLTLLVRAVDAVRGAFTGTGAALAGAASAVGEAFGAMGRAIGNAATAVLSAFGRIGEGARAALAGVQGAFASVARGIDEAVASARGAAGRMLSAVPDALLPGPLVALKQASASGAATPLPPAATLPAGARLTALAAAPAVAEASGRAQATAAPPNAATAPPGPERPLVVQVQVDGETIARAAAKASAESASRSFSPLPAY